MNNTNSITQEKLKEVFDYNPDTGIFTWKNPTSKRIKAGHQCLCKNNLGYIVIKVMSKYYSAHRLAWFYVHGEWPKNQIDHINQIKHDNRICNLKDVTCSENMQNQKQIKGYTKSGNKFKATIRLNNKLHQLGTYGTKDEARQAYLQAKNKLHTNFNY